MKPVLIIKLGDTLPDLAARKGDFEDWFMKPFHQVDLATRVVDPRRGEALPLPVECAGILVTGSHAMVTDQKGWSRTTAAWLPSAVAAHVPLLGVCYGHQLLADAMGGTVANHPQGMEMGTVDIRLTPETDSDLLFKAFPGVIKVHASHSQTVIRLPPDAVLLAANAWEPHHAFAVGDCAWGIQFHPEFDAEIMSTYINAFADELRKQGQHPDDLLQKIEATPDSRRVLERFARIVLEKANGK
jgi:GMP synthase (glutamine-hydrolysing)